MFRGVAQMVARMVWDHEVAGSRPVTPTIIIKQCVFCLIAEVAQW